MPARRLNLGGPRDEFAPKQKHKHKTRPTLDALAIAEGRYPSGPKIPRHRLGESGELSKRKINTTRDGHKGDTPVMKRRRIGHVSPRPSDNEDNEWQLGEIGSDDDSELDSDEAMGSSDEEKFKKFSFCGSPTTRPKRKQDAFNSRGNTKSNRAKNFGGVAELSSNGPEDDLGEDAVDLATAWDMNAEDEDPHSEYPAPKGNLAEGISDVSESDENDFGDYSGLSVSGDDESADTERALSKLQTFVNSMGTDTPKSLGVKAARALEQGAPTEYGLTATRKLTVADLIPSINNSILKSSLKHLDTTSSTPKLNSTGATGKLAAPLPKRQQNRLDRAAAYEKSKETLDRWIETVKANRRAEHLFFPFSDDRVQQLGRITPVQSQTDLESTIKRILVESGLAESNEKSAEDQIQASEELEARNLSLEEMRARIAELRKHRDLLFREELRAKRIKKIKSKSYRRIHRREREKITHLERQALAEAGIGVGDEETERNYRRRAEARMGAKHRESKWAKNLKHTGRTAWDEEAQTSVVDMARRDEELRKRIEGRRINNEGDDFLGSSSSESDDHEDLWPEEPRSDAEARFLLRELNDFDSEGKGVQIISGPHSKLFSMKFMRNAEAARKLQNDVEVKRLRQEILNENPQSKSEIETGRQKFGYSAAETTEHQRLSHSKNEFEEAVESDSDGTQVSEQARVTALTNGYEQQKRNSSSQSAHSHHPGSKEREAENSSPENPWLHQSSQKRGRKTSPCNEAVDITLDTPVSGGHHPVTHEDNLLGNTVLEHRSKAPQPSEGGNGNDESASEDDACTPILLKDHDLVRRAFAGDEVIQDFEEDKLKTIEEEGDKIIDNTLPGWGTWTGEGISKKQQKHQKRFLTTIEGVKPDQRKDAKLTRVIINEKRVRKNTKYLATQLPHPFESRQQYERSLRIPIGQEWITKETFQDSTKPRVMIKQGVIKPLEKPLL